MKPNSKNARDIFERFDEIVQESQGKSHKQTSFVKKMSVDLDAEHLDIIIRRQQMPGVHIGSRGVIWEALELLAEKYNITSLSQN